MKKKLGVINYDYKGRPICNICGKGFNKLISHVVQKHNMDSLTYKKKFGYDTTKGIMSKKSTEIAREQALKNLPKIIDNLIEKGKNTRFKKGSEGRTKNKISPQTAIWLKNNKLNKYGKK